MSGLTVVCGKQVLEFHEFHMARLPVKIKGAVKFSKWKIKETLQWPLIEKSNVVSQI